MGQIIEFNNSINNTNNRIIEIFKDTLNDIKEAIQEESTDDIINNLKFFYNYIESLLKKVERGNWKSLPVEEKFISCFESLKKKNEDDDIISRAFLQSELVYISDINSSVLNEDNVFVHSVVTGIDNNIENFDSNSKVIIDKIVKIVTKPIIKSIFNDKDNMDRKMESVIEAILDEEDILSIYSWYSNNSDDKDISDQSLNEGIITLKRVYDYYLNQAQLIHELRLYSSQKSKGTLDFSDPLYDKEISSISKILLLKHYPEEYKELYLKIVKIIHESRDILTQLREVVKITDFYIENRENITNFNENDIIMFMINGTEEKSDKIANRRL